MHNIAYGVHVTKKPTNFSNRLRLVRVSYLKNKSHLPIRMKQLIVSFLCILIFFSLVRVIAGELC